MLTPSSLRAEPVERDTEGDKDDTDEEKAGKRRVVRGFAQVQSRAQFNGHSSHALFVDAGITSALMKQIEANFYGLWEGEWGELLAGPLFSFNPMKELELSMCPMGGGERAANEVVTPRYAFLVLTKYRQIDALIAVEANNETLDGTSGSGLFYFSELNYHPVRPVGLGGFLRRPDGIGPKVSWTFGPATTWAAWTPFLPEEIRWRAGHILSGIELAL